MIGNGRIVSLGTKNELLRAAGSIARAADGQDLARALTESGITSWTCGEGTLRADADPEQVGKIAFAAGLPLVELRAADGAGLEELFLELTADTQRDTHREGAVA